jgi:hypothetical protein
MSYQLPFRAAQPLKREMHWNLSTIYLPKQANQSYLTARRRLMRDDGYQASLPEPGSDAYIENHAGDGENQLLTKYF